MIKYSKSGGQRPLSEMLCCVNGEKLRAMMPWTAKNKLVDKAKN